MEETNQQLCANRILREESKVNDELPSQSKAKNKYQSAITLPLLKKSVYRLFDKKFPQRVNGLRKGFVSKSHFAGCSRHVKPEI